MVTCPKCNTVNPLGRVFCGGCGGKLDLEALSRQEVGRRLQEQKWKRLWRPGVGLVVGWVLLLAVLALWPRAAVIGAAGTKPAGKRVEDQLKTMALIGARQKLGVTFAEADLNGYIEHMKGSSMGVQSFSVACAPSAVRVRVVRRLFNFEFKGFEFVPVMSQDLICIPVGGRLYPRSASIGHLKLWGFARHACIRSVHRLVAAQREWQVLGPMVSSLEAEQGKLTIVVAR